MNSEECLKQFTTDLQYRLAKSTLEDYQRSVKQLFIFTKKPFDGITKRDIRNWLSHLVENGYRPATVQVRLSGLKTFFNYCKEEELILLNPAEELPFPRRDETVPCYLKWEQLTQLRKHVERGLRERALIEVLYTTGVRISELAAMKKEDINWSERSILIPSGKGKKGRNVFFTPECAEYLEVYLNKRTDNLPYVFSDAKGIQSFRISTNKLMFRTISKQLGFKVTNHILRHTFAAHLAQKGMPLEYIQVLLGHHNIQTTKVYTRLYDIARKEMYDDWM
ncbi:MULTISPECIES: tyrosine-type recombinase/integrase [Bacillus]|uniref:tyrosine-type recombinase/integrase n=1 Tax=Bacillus TaxID=1386 RepID=UPI0002D3790F|nr:MULTISPECIES: tyrosine-type recombinase/integrase [Bacillus]